MIKEITYSELIKKVHETLQHKSIFINEDMELLNLENGLSIVPMVFDTECNYLFLLLELNYLRIFTLM